MKANAATGAQDTQYIIAFLVVCLIGAGLSYQYGKRSTVEQKKTSDKTYVKNNVTEKLI